MPSQLLRYREVSTNFEAHRESEVNISGGTVGGGFDTNADSLVNISGGSVGDEVDANSGSEMNISGGSVGRDFDAFSGSEVSLFGSEFLLNDVLLESLVPGEAFTITERNVLLSGMLTDGTPLDFNRNGTNSFSQDFFDPASTLTVTMVEEGDFDFDGDVEIDDVDFYIGSLGLFATGELVRLDLDSVGVVTVADHNLHVNALVTASNAVTGRLLGDVSLDGSVNVLDDAFELVGNLGLSVTSQAQGDLNADGVVNVLGDAFLLVGNLDESTSLSAAPVTTAIPDPRCLAVLVVGALALSHLRRRRSAL